MAPHLPVYLAGLKHAVVSDKLVKNQVEVNQRLGQAIHLDDITPAKRKGNETVDPAESCCFGREDKTRHRGRRKKVTAK